MSGMPQAAPSQAPAPDPFVHYDLEDFAKQFFPRHCALEWSRLHRYLIERRQAKTAAFPPARRGQLDIVLAPRGAAKSTLMSLVFPVHAMLCGHDPYIVLFSATQRQASQRLANIRSLLLNSKPLQQTFADRLEPGCGRASSKTLTIGNARMDAFSAGSEVRGLGHGEWRPTWIILDDVERSDRVRSARQREALVEWFDEVIVNLGSGTTNIDLVGTLLHRDALPARLMLRPDACAATFVSIESEADRQDLWEAWRARYLNLNDPDRLATARAFFEARSESMLAGARVLWSQKEDYYDLCALRERIGRRAFDKEKQNQPPEDQGQLFHVSSLRRFRIERDRIIRDPPIRATGVAPMDSMSPEIGLGELSVYGFLDPAMGGARGDYAAAAIVGIDRAGNLYVLDVWLERATPSRQIERIFELHELWSCVQFAVESTCFQQVLLDPIREYCEVLRGLGRGRMAQLSVVGRPARGAKTERIARLETKVANGWLLFNASLSRLFLDQLESFPTGRHDDGPDALAGAVALAEEGRATDMSGLTRAPRARSGLNGFG